MARTQARSRFQRAVEATAGIKNAYRSGIQALEAADKSRLSKKEYATGSVFLDDVLKKSQPNANRWDYGVGVGDGKTESVVWIEVHHAASKQGDLVARKLQWLKDWLSTSAPELARMPRAFVWLLSNVEANPNDRLRRNRDAERMGLIRRQGMLSLDEFLGERG